MVSEDECKKWDWTGWYRIESNRNESSGLYCTKFYNPKKMWSHEKHDVRKTQANKEKNIERNKNKNAIQIYQQKFNKESLNWVYSIHKHGHPCTNTNERCNQLSVSCARTPYSVGYSFSYNSSNENSEHTEIAELFKNVYTLLCFTFTFFPLCLHFHLCNARKMAIGYI